MIYNYNKTINVSQLESEIRESSITIALESVTSLDSDVTITFKANLSTQEEDTLDILVDDHVPVSDVNEPTLVDLNIPKDVDGALLVRSRAFANADGFRFRGASFSGTATAMTTTNLDYKITEERYINGGRLLVSNIGDDDKITFQVVDKDNILGYGANVVLDEFIKDYFVPTAGNLEVRLDYPAKIPANLYLRLKYTNSSLTSASIKCNLYLHWKAS